MPRGSTELRKRGKPAAIPRTGTTGGLGGAGPLGGLVRHTHLKDVKAVGGHATCLIGEGVVVSPEACIRALRAQGYEGRYSWEDEPEDRNPMDSAERNRLWIEERLGEGSFPEQEDPVGETPPSR